LNRKLVVERTGNVTIPLIGDIQVVGLTLQEIQPRILQAIRDLYPSINRIELSITEMVSQVVYVIGQVGNPGRYVFPSPPNLWEAIREAGGPTLEAALTNVRIVKDPSTGGASMEVNVQEALDAGTVEQLPVLEGGDTVVIERSTTAYSGALV
jgi:protein involved in polysaccharide export with SLBB domain